MKKINFKKLTGQNFLSIGNDSIVIDFQKGLNLITGKNIDNPERQNAVGKSAISELFFYSLYGTTIRDIKKEFIINNVTKGKGLIELEFDVETDQGISSYRISRQLKPSTVELWKVGVDKDEDISKDSISNTNKYICDLIGSNPSISKSCDILSLSDNIPFMAKKPEEKRKFIEDIFSLEVFGKMLKELKELIKENKSDTNISTAKINEIDNSLTTLINQKESYKRQQEEREDVLNSRKNSLIDKIFQIEREMEECELFDTSKMEVMLSKLESGKNKLDESIFDDGKLIAGNETSIKLKQEEIKRASSVGGAKCDKCFQDIPHTHIEALELMKNQLSEELEVMIDNNQEVLRSKDDSITRKKRIQIQIDRYIKVINEYKSNQIKFDRLKDSLEYHKNNLKNLEEDVKLQDYPLFDDSILETEKRKSDQEEILNQLKQKSDDYESCRFILGEEGVKSFIIKRLLDMLNSSIQNYITRLGMTMRCKFDEYFDEKITNDKGKDISYWNFSGGERRTVDLACAWAFKDIKKKISGITSNVEFLDEILDSAFDSVGYDRLIEVIKDRIDQYSISCYAISHRNETLKHITGEIVNLEKENGLTRRV